MPLHCDSALRHCETQLQTSYKHANCHVISADISVSLLIVTSACYAGISYIMPGDDVCSICLHACVQEPGMSIQAMTCGHSFHTYCISTYCDSQHTDIHAVKCPYCKQTEADVTASAEKAAAEKAERDRAARDRDRGGARLRCSDCDRR